MKRTKTGCSIHLSYLRAVLAWGRCSSMGGEKRFVNDEMSPAISWLRTWNHQRTDFGATPVVFVWRNKCLSFFDESSIVCSLLVNDWYQQTNRNNWSRKHNVESERHLSENASSALQNCRMFCETSQPRRNCSRQNCSVQNRFFKGCEWLCRTWNSAHSGISRAMPRRTTEAIANWSCASCSQNCEANQIWCAIKISMN